jgi:hypothetical protein
VSEILSDWSLADLLLFGGVFTAVAGGAAIFLAESWFQKMRQRREHFKIWQDRQFKIWQEQQRESFLRLGRDQQGFDDKNEDNSQKNRPLPLHENFPEFTCGEARPLIRFDLGIAPSRPTSITDARRYPAKDCDRY